MNILTEEELLILIINFGMMALNQTNVPQEVTQRNKLIIDKLIVMREEMKNGKRAS
ncbi:hypothetical protein [Massilimicrobiota timonensis]|uniref:hypothetical protein n=1 Tax=Massilimicrobiota timonensis TaxID=1776392 RepID=UPI0013A651BC|nr:hypothetical protein [Massilimicrobiota timonensis]